MVKAAASGRVAAASLAVIAGVTVLWPALFVAWGVVRGAAALPSDAVGAAVPDLALLLKTAGIAALIAAGAAAVGWPAAWSMRVLPARVHAILALPLLLPSYLISSGWGLLRGPEMPLGQWLLRPEHQWLVVPTGYALAIAGLMLWASPLAALLIGAQLRRTDPEVFESLRLAAPSRPRYWLAVLGAARGGVLAAGTAVFLVMLGSAVPLHVAQLDTYAIALWRTLDETGAATHWRVWLTSWPLAVVAVAAAWWATARLTAESAEGARQGHAGEERVRLTPALFAAGCVWTLAVLAPALLFILSLRGVQPLSTFWRVAWPSIVGSAWVSVIAGAIAVCVAGAVWVGLAGGAGARRATRLSVGVLMVGGLVPGVLVGSATARAWGSAAWLAPVADSSAVVILGHLARFAFFAALAGVWMAATEPRHLRDLRRLEAGDTWRGWLLGAMPAQGAVLLGTGLAVGLLSFHEIEATVMLQPAGSAGGGFAWVMLQQLHFFRTQELAAGTIYVIGAGLVTGTAIMILAGRRARTPRSRHR